MPSLGCQTNLLFVVDHLLQGRVLIISLEASEFLMLYPGSDRAFDNIYPFLIPITVHSNSDPIALSQNPFSPAPFHDASPALSGVRPKQMRPVLITQGRTAPIVASLIRLGNRHHCTYSCEICAIWRCPRRRNWARDHAIEDLAGKDINRLDSTVFPLSV